MAQYNVSKNEAKKLGIERVLVSGGDAKSYINANQQSDAASKSAIKTRTNDYNDIVEDITGVKRKDIKAPDLPQFEESYTNLRGQYGITGLETTLNDLNTQAEEIAAQFRVNKSTEEGKFVGTNVAEGRASTHERAANERLDAVNRSINTITNQLNTAYNVVNTIMNYKAMDYDAAVTQYNTQFSQYMQTFNLVQGIDEQLKTEAQRAQDNARANLQIMYNNIAENSQGIGSLSKDQRSQISKLEAQAGLPTGTYKTIESKNPGGKIVSTTTRTDANGNKVADMIVIDPKTGQPKTITSYIGKDYSSGGGNNDEIKVANENYIYNKLSGAAKVEDGFVDPTVWKAALNEWQGAGGSTSDFYSKFGGKINDRGKRTGGFINPNDF